MIHHTITHHMLMYCKAYLNISKETPWMQNFVKKYIAVSNFKEKSIKYRPLHVGSSGQYELVLV